MAERQPLTEETTFEEALKRLEEVISRMEAPELPLEKSLILYEEGQALVKFCAARLEEIEQRIQTVSEGEGGLELEPLGEEGSGEE